MKAMAIMAILLAVGVCVRGIQIFRRETAEFHPARSPVKRPPTGHELEGMRDVAFRSASGDLVKGWFVPSRNRAGVILAHGSSADRRQLLPEATILARHGYGVLMFDSPGHGESSGSVKWGEPERQGLVAALGFLANESGVDTTRLGALGFSMGGVIVAQVAARDTRLRAIVLSATFADAIEQTRFLYGRLGGLWQWPARFAGRRAGANEREMRPIESMPGLSPRPVLFIAGGDDTVVPAWMVQRLYDAASEPKQFWVVPRAGHGGYDGFGAEYERRLCSFFDASLPARAPASAERR
jgi:dipeptidyl aminopeptidase/acylaminoacyl peptidase